LQVLVAYLWHSLRRQNHSPDTTIVAARSRGATVTSASKRHNLNRTGLQSGAWATRHTSVFSYKYWTAAVGPFANNQILVASRFSSEK